MTASQIVSELNIDRRKLGQVLIQCKVIKQSGKIKYYLIQDVIKHLYNKTDKLISLEEARKNKAIAEAELLELNLEKEKGNVLDRDLVDKQWANLVLSCKNRLEAIPNKLAPILAVESGIDVSIVANRVIEALLNNELYIFTHPNYRQLVQKRFKDIDDAFINSEKSPHLKDILNKKLDML